MILEFPVKEMILCFVQAIVLWLLKWDNRFTECINFSAYLVSVVTMCHLGIEVFDALVKSEWRHSNVMDPKGL